MSEFCFPFEPYSIQRAFMGEALGVFESGRLGIFESPTGTGKSLSLICAAGTWLRKAEEADRRTAERLQAEAKAVEKADDWVSGLGRKMEIEKELDGLRSRLEKEQLTADRIATATSASHALKEQRQHPAAKRPLVSDELEELEEDADLLPSDEPESSEKDTAAEEPFSSRKIFYASRTHSQLAQFLSEVKKTEFRSLRVTTLGARKSLCVNAAVAALRSNGAINERCLEMQTNSSSKKAALTDSHSGGVKAKRTKGGGKCKAFNAGGIAELSVRQLSGGLDVEELVKEGRTSVACPYYAARLSVPAAQLVLLPYPTLLLDSARAANALNLSGNVVIVDEAHNLLQALASSHAVALSAAQLGGAHAQLAQYLLRFRARLSPDNLRSLRQLLHFLGGLVGLLRRMSGQEWLGSPGALVTQAGIADVNVCTLAAYMDKARIARKVSGYAAKYTPTLTVDQKDVDGLFKDNQVEAKRSGLSRLLAGKKDVAAEEPAHTKPPAQPSANSLFQIRTLLECLSFKPGDGRILVKDDTLQFFLLNPARLFKKVVDEAGSVLLAGGTMEPSGELIRGLRTACELPLERIHRFSCLHVIDPSQLMAVALTKGAGSKFPIKLDYSSRSQPGVMAEVGRTLSNLMRMIPAGVVIFVQSYDYLDTLITQWTSTGVVRRDSGQLFLGRKRLFREPRAAAETERVLGGFASSAKGGGGGGALLAVVGGKLSEGLNFGDELGRGVVVLGLPYPNRTEPVLREKMRYLEGVERGAGDEHYEAICLKAVNQSIGRAIRHRNDFAAVILLDERYASPRIQKQLPAWIARSLSTHTQFGPLLPALKTFFDARNSGCDS